MVTLVKGKIIDKFAQEWEMDGKKGVTQKLVIYVGKGKVENVSLPTEVEKFYDGKINDDIELECDCFIRKNGTYNLKACTE